MTLTADQENEILRLYESGAFEELESRFGSDPKAASFLFQVVRDKRRGSELASVLEKQVARPGLHVRLAERFLEVVEQNLGPGLELFFPEPLLTRGETSSTAATKNTDLNLGSAFRLRAGSGGVFLVFQHPGKPFEILRDGEIHLKGNRLLQTELELAPGDYEISYDGFQFALRVEA